MHTVHQAASEQERKKQQQQPKHPLLLLFESIEKWQNENYYLQNSVLYSQMTL